jgi:hypothetical protein
MFHADIYLSIQFLTQIVSTVVVDFLVWELALKFLEFFGEAGGVRERNSVPQSSAARYSGRLLIVLGS